MDNFNIRTALEEDFPRIIELLADIVISKNPLRYADETVSAPPLQSYIEAFREILSPPNTALVAALNSQVVGYTQISFVPGLTRNS